MRNEMEAKTKEAIGLDELIKFLNDSGVKAELINIDKYGFSRTIGFKVYDIDYRIEWYKNQSTLEIGTGNRPSCIPFKWVYFDTSYPLVNGNKSIGFAYEKLKRNSMWDREYRFEVFRIPIELITNTPKP